MKLQPKQEARFEYKGFPCVILFITMGCPWGYDCMKYEVSVLEKDFSNTNFSPIFEVAGGGVGDRTVD